MITLKQLIPALISLGVDETLVNEAIKFLREMLVQLDEVEVKGRQQVDTLLGCMMAIEAIIGKEGGEANG
jgi:hypothetical protein